MWHNLTLPPGLCPRPRQPRSGSSEHRPLRVPGGAAAHCVLGRQLCQRVPAADRRDWLHARRAPSQPAQRPARPRQPPPLEGLRPPAPKGHSPYCFHHCYFLYQHPSCYYHCTVISFINILPAIITVLLFPLSISLLLVSLLFHLSTSLLL